MFGFAATLGVFGTIRIPSDTALVVLVTGRAALPDPPSKVVVSLPPSMPAAAMALSTDLVVLS